MSGYDYDEFYLDDITNFSFAIHSVDELFDETSTVTLRCNANISVNCFYKDYDNAPYDSEEKEYVWVDTIEMREEHKSYFPCRIEINRETKEFRIIPFTIILGGDSMEKRYVLENVNEQELQDMERENLGLNPLGSYETFLEEELPDSDMSKEIIEKFKEIDSLFNVYEEFADVYDCLLAKLDDKAASSETTKLVIKNLGNKVNLFENIDCENITYKEIDLVKKWTNTKFDDACEIEAMNYLPDFLNYGDNIEIKGINGDEIFLSIDELNILPSEGDEEIIGVNLSNKEEILASGYVKLTVGYLSFDEEGNVGDGINDNIEYNYDEIINKINEFICTQKEKIEKESEIVELIKDIIY